MCLCVYVFEDKHLLICVIMMVVCVYIYVLWQCVSMCWCVMFV